MRRNAMIDFTGGNRGNGGEQPELGLLALMVWEHAALFSSLPSVRKYYSARSVIAGSILAARRAGSQLARAATANRNPNAAR